MRKKILAIILAAALVFSFSVTAFAESGSSSSGSTSSSSSSSDKPAKPPSDSSSDSSSGDRPAKPPSDSSSDSSSGSRPEKPSVDSSSSDKPGDPPSGSAPGGSSSSVSYSGATTITSSDSQSGKKYSSTTADENALLINTSDNVTISDPTVTKSGDSDGGDNCNFYGINSGIMVMGGGTTTITGGTIETTATGANGVFSYGGNGGQNGAEGDGTTVVIKNTVINTTGDNAGGIMTTGGGITKAENLTVTTSGRSSAAIRTDRGGGTVTVAGGSYTTSGLGSPAIYSTADITVSDATLVSNLSEGVCIEGKNSVTVNNSSLTANNTEMNGNATFLDTIMIYQSMSGDADSGTSSYTMNGGSLTSKSGHVFHVTNTNAVINLSGVSITNEDGENILLSVCDDGWSGAENIATLNADAQTLEGTILVGDNSTLTLNLTNSSVFTGTVSGEITNAKGDTVSTEVGTVSVTLDDTSKWFLTGDTYITEFNGNAANVINNGYTLYVNGVALEGTSDSGELPVATDTADSNDTMLTAIIGAAALAIIAVVAGLAIWKKKSAKKSDAENLISADIQTAPEQAEQPETEEEEQPAPDNMTETENE